MHFQISIEWWVAIIVVIFLFWVMYRLIKKFTRRCECGRWLLVERVKIMEPDQDAFDDDILGKMYFSYILGVCTCELVQVYAIYRKRFTKIELWWRHIYHPSEFNRPDAQVLLEKAGIDLCGHSSAEKIGHKPQIPTVMVDDMHYSRKVPVLSPAREVFRPRAANNPD